MKKAKNDSDKMHEIYSQKKKDNMELLELK